MAKELTRRLRNEDDYDAALMEIEHFFDNEPAPETPEADRFDLLALLIQDYEEKRWPIEPPEDLEAIRFAMEIGGHTQADLGRVLGSRQRASDIMSGKRPLTMRMAWRLNQTWSVPAEALINSTVIKTVTYREEARELTVTFVTGRTYVYFGVEPDIYSAFLDAPSKGSFFNSTIRNRFLYQETPAPDSDDETVALPARR